MPVTAYLIIAASVTVPVLLIFAVFYGNIKKKTEEITKDALNDIENLLDDSEDSITERITHRVTDIRTEVNERLRQDADENRLNRKEIKDMLLEGQERQRRELTEFREKTELALRTGMNEIREGSETKLREMEKEINEKLETGLNERLDASFRSVGEQLNKLYVSLGELGKLENGVSNLNKTLSNVKTRGVFGETQLENILANILSPGLYDRNVVTKVSEGHNRDMVEFAVRIPDKETGKEFIYLPIDSKFPADIYDRIRTASEDNNGEELKKGIRELEMRIREEAKEISTKYLDPPHTTDFAIMFLPTESLYAEVLRIPGLAEEIQKKNHIVITGPVTIAALLNSLSVGFRYMAVNRDSQNILKLLSAIKTQYRTLSELIETANSRIDLARKATTDMQHRTEMINRKLSAVEEMDPIEARSLLGISRSSDQDA